MHYFYLVKTISNKDYLAIEKHYHRTGILSRTFYGGFVEEIIFRWGIMSLLLWLLQFIFEPLNMIAVVIAIGISSILFSLVHLPSIKMVSSEPKPSMYVYTIIGNIWVGIFTGWAFLEAGIFSAIIVHNFIPYTMVSDSKGGNSQKYKHKFSVKTVLYRFL